MSTTARVRVIAAMMPPVTDRQRSDLTVAVGTRTWARLGQSPRHVGGRLARAAGFEPATFSSGGQLGRLSDRFTRVIRTVFGCSFGCFRWARVRTGAQFGAQLESAPFFDRSGRRESEQAT